MNENDRCQAYSVDPCAVSEAKARLPEAQALDALARMFQAFGDASRLKIMLAVQERELCVCELGELLEMSSPAVSHHLRRLKDLGLVKTRREGKLVYYSLDDEHIRDLLVTGRAHMNHRF